MSVLAIAADTVASSPVTAVGSLLAHGLLYLRPRLLLQQSSLQWVLCPHQCDTGPSGSRPLEAEVISLATQGQPLVSWQQLRGDGELLPAMGNQWGCHRQSRRVLWSHAGAQAGTAFLGFSC